MSTPAPSKWPSRRRVSEANSSRRGGTRLATDERTGLGASRGGLRPRQAARVQASAASPSAPIDVEAIEDDVLLLSHSGMFPQGGNQHRRKRPVTVVLDEDSDVQVGSAGISGESETQVTVNKREKRPPKRPLINREAYENYKNTECSSNSKEQCVMENPEPQKTVLKEPAFTCAICLGHIIEETSTICGHIFCHGCIKAAIQTHRKCPTCRKSLTMKNIHRVYLPTAH